MLFSGDCLFVPAGNVIKLNIHVPEEHFVGRENPDVTLRAVGTLCAGTGFLHKTFPWNVKTTLIWFYPQSTPLGYNDHSLNLMTLPSGTVCL
jgi:hypothetical protein